MHGYIKWVEALFPNFFSTRRGNFKMCDNAMTSDKNSKKGQRLVGSE